MTGEADTNSWAGHKVELYPTKTQMGGRTVDCIRVRTPAVPTARKEAAKPPAKYALGEEMNEDIPF